MTYARDPCDIERYQRVRTAAMRMAAQGFAIDPLSLEAIYGRSRGYATPQVDVRGAVFRDDQVLLVLERSDGKWSLPGGWAEVNRTPKENVAREIEEEAGVTVEVRRLAAIYDRRRHPYAPPEPLHVYKMYFLCAMIGGEPRAGDETLAAEFFPLHDLPELSLARVLAPHIRQAYEHHLDPHLPPHID